MLSKGPRQPFPFSSSLPHVRRLNTSIRVLDSELQKKKKKSRGAIDSIGITKLIKNLMQPNKIKQTANNYLRKPTSQF